MVLEAAGIPSHGASPIILIQLCYATPSMSAFVKPMNPTIPASCDALSFEITRREQLLQDVVGEVPRRACGSLGRSSCEDRTSLSRGQASTSSSRKECERVAGLIKVAVAKVLV